MMGLGVESLHPLDFFGFFLPPFAAWIPIAFVPFLFLRWALGRVGFYDYVWHRPLFDVALFVVFLGALVFSGGTRWL